MTSRRPKRELALGLLVLLAAGAAAEDWPGWGGPRGNFVANPSAALDAWSSDGPSEIWRRDLGPGDSAIISDGTRLFTLYRDGSRNVVVALEAATGATVWEHSWSAPDQPFLVLDYGPPLHSTAALGDGTLVAVGSLGRMVALDAATGALRWQRELWADLGGTRLERGYAASPLVYDDLVVAAVGGRSGALVAFRLTDGAIVWQSPRAEIAYSSPIEVRIGGRPQIVALLDEELLAVEPSSGEALWRHPLRRHRYVNTATPLQSPDGRIVVVTSDGARLISVLPVADGFAIEDVWVERSIGSQVGNIILVDGHLYGVKGGSTSFLVSVNIETGQPNWRYRPIGDSNLLLAGDRLLVLEDGGRLHLLDPSPEEPRVLASTKVLSGRLWTAPTLVDGRLYARDRRQIVALDLSPRSR